jgi:hypothetical protein
MFVPFFRSRTVSEDAVGQTVCWTVNLWKNTVLWGISKVVAWIAQELCKGERGSYILPLIIEYLFATLSTPGPTHTFRFFRRRSIIPLPLGRGLGETRYRGMLWCRKVRIVLSDKIMDGCVGFSHGRLQWSDSFVDHVGIKLPGRRTGKRCSKAPSDYLE